MFEVSPRDSSSSGLAMLPAQVFTHFVLFCLIDFRLGALGALRLVRCHARGLRAKILQTPVRILLDQHLRTVLIPISFIVRRRLDIVGKYHCLGTRRLRLGLQHISAPGLAFLDQFTASQAWPSFALLPFYPRRQADEAVGATTRDGFVWIRNVRLCRSDNAARG